MKQISMFPNNRDSNEDIKYTNKVESPIYKPSHKKPHILELYDKSKTNKLIAKIQLSALPDDEKVFLIEAAKRHTVFNYERIADYYAHSTPDMQRLMEDSALVIIDFEKAIERGYIRLCDDIKREYLEEYGEQ